MRTCLLQVGICGRALEVNDVPEYTEVVNHNQAGLSVNEPPGPAAVIERPRTEHALRRRLGRAARELTAIPWSRVAIVHHTVDRYFPRCPNRGGQAQSA